MTPPFAILTVLGAGSLALSITTDARAYDFYGPGSPKNAYECSLHFDHLAKELRREQWEREQNCKISRMSTRQYQACYEELGKRRKKFADRIRRGQEDCWERVPKAVRDEPFLVEERRRDEETSALQPISAPPATATIGAAGQEPVSPTDGLAAPVSPRQEQCTRLARLRDGFVFQQFVASERGVAVAREAQQDLRDLIALTRRASKIYGASAFAKEFLQLTQIGAGSLQALLNVFVPAGTVVNELSRSMKLAGSFAATEFAKRAASSVEIAHEVTVNTPQIEQWLAFGELMPIVGEVVGVLKTTREFLQTRAETEIDLRGFGARIQDLEGRLDKAANQLERQEFRRQFTGALKHEIDSKCGTKAVKPAPALAGSEPTTRLAPVLEQVIEAAKPPVSMSSAPGEDCGVLDDGVASMELALERSDVFEALVLRCRGLRK